jgi:hypothetical protein
VLGFLVGGYQCAKWAYDMISPEFQVQEYDEENL